MTRLDPNDRPERQRRGGRARPAGFTLTEILIALAITSLLLVGISRIFGLTSATIGSGQSLSKALRSHKAIQTAMSNDVIGTGDAGRPDYQSGMLPLVNTADPRYATPFIAITNFRVAAYKNKADQDADAVNVGAPVPPTNATTAATLNADYIARSHAIRGVDLNGDGAEDPLATPVSIYAAAPGETIPIYAYGERNFRSDMLSIFAKGIFESQTGSEGYVDPVTSTEAWIWYGHLRTFNGNTAAINDINGFGNPGDWFTDTNATFTTAGENRNARYADDFRLGRYAMLLVEPIDAKAINNNLGDTPRFQQNTVVANGDVTKPVAFVRRNWWSPTSGSASTMLPISTTAGVFKFLPTTTTGTNVQVMQFREQEVPLGTTVAGSVATTAAMCRTDVGGAGLTQLRQRAEYVSAASPINWRDNLPNTWNTRFWVNPFPVQPISARSLSQRQQLMSDACSQFIVEFAGDFVTQNLGTGAVSGTIPDGVLDFAIVDGLRQTRFYGLPRDVDGDGKVLIGSFATSLDVLPVRDVIGTAQAFERTLPPLPTSGGDYLTILREPSGNNPNNTRYACSWGPVEFNNTTTVLIGGKEVLARPVPQLLRITVDIRDPGGRLKEAVTQSFTLPVRVSAYVEPPQTP